MFDSHFYYIAVERELAFGRIGADGEVPIADAREKLVIEELPSDIVFLHNFTIYVESKNQKI
ncbi:3861_t:CDS:2 [Racocetra fulgida]|uniref:3861_t:CDS:1 n=1 Tax=Racocetra fulgida TaxID=60492 RepID=A0A9N9CFH9_9GLOM|nr:3861_t:CDS:2 [Racocetra fulgida]